MNGSGAVRCLGAAVLSASLAAPAPCQDSTRGWQGGHGRFFWVLTPDDVILPVSSLEWGGPDRWSLTSRYIHLFTKNRDHNPWIHSATVSLSPGTDGGRLGFGYSGVWPGPAKATLHPEARLVLLRTWRNPLQTAPNRTFLGAEIRCSAAGLVNVGAGWYRSTASQTGRTDSFWGFHLGVGM